MDLYNTKWTDALPWLIGVVALGLLTAAVPFLWPLWVVIALVVLGVERKRRQERNQ